MSQTASNPRISKLDLRLTPRAKAARQRFALDAEQWTGFQEALDASPKPLAPRLRRLLQEKSVFEAE